MELAVFGILTGIGYLLQTNNSSLTKPVPKAEKLTKEQNRVEEVRQEEFEAASKMYDRSKRWRNTGVVPTNLKEVDTEHEGVYSQLSGTIVPRTHNNMTPFFGAKVKQSVDVNVNQPVLENFTGVSDFFKSKKEVPTFYDGAQQNIYGQQNVTDFIRDRVVLPRNTNNIFPLEKRNVGPGINRGFDETPVGGFQQLDVQEFARPRTVDDLRVKTNPKETFRGEIIPGKSLVDKSETAFFNVDNNRPQRASPLEFEYYVPNSASNSKQTERSEVQSTYTNLRGTEQEEYYPPADKQTGRKHKIDYEYYEPPKKKCVNSDQLLNANLEHIGSKQEDFNFKGYTAPTTYRELTVEQEHTGIVTNYIKSLTSPLLDLVRFSKKEYLTQPAREQGQFQALAHMPSKPTIYDPRDTAKTTIKETLIHDNRTGNIVGLEKKTIVYDPHDLAKTTVRETTDDFDYERNIAPDLRKTTMKPADQARVTNKETTLSETAKGIATIDHRGGYEVAPNEPSAKVRPTAEYFGVAENETRDGYTITDVHAPMTNKETTTGDYTGAADTYAKEMMDRDSERRINEIRELTLEGRKFTGSKEKSTIAPEKFNVTPKLMDPQNDKLIYGKKHLQISSKEHIGKQLGRDKVKLDRTNINEYVENQLNDNPYAISITSQNSHI